MQNKSIDGALIALRKQIIRENLDGLEHVGALMRLRGVRMPTVLPAKGNVARRNEMRRLVLAALRDGPKTRVELVNWIAPFRPELDSDRLYRRTDNALTKLSKAGVVRVSGGVWVSGEIVNDLNQLSG